MNCWYMRRIFASAVLLLFSLGSGQAQDFPTHPLPRRRQGQPCQDQLRHARRGTTLHLTMEQIAKERGIQ